MRHVLSLAGTGWKAMARRVGTACVSARQSRPRLPSLLQQFTRATASTAFAQGSRHQSERHTQWL